MRERDMTTYGSTDKKSRQSKYCLHNNCTIVQIVDGEAYLFNKKIYNICNPKTDFNYPDSYIEFFYAEPKDEKSINQSPGTILQKINLNLLIGWELIHAFEEINKQNIEKINNMR